MNPGIRLSPRAVRQALTLAAFTAALAAFCGKSAVAGEAFDTVILNGLVVDGTGGPSYIADVGIKGDRIAIIGDLSSVMAQNRIDAKGLVVAPGFTNSMSWATTTLIEDGRAQSDIRQGVTMEIMSEGFSPGPLNGKMKAAGVRVLGTKDPEIEWTTLGEYLSYVENKGASVNFASYVGASTVREYVIGRENRRPTKNDLEEMKNLVKNAMQDGAVGISSALIYTPGSYATTEELIELAKVASRYGGTYASHMRSEGNRLIEGVEELIRIAQEANITSEIYHLKAAGVRNWPKMNQVIDMVYNARCKGLPIYANMYTFEAGATGLDAAVPRWIQEGDFKVWTKKLQDPEIRQRLVREMNEDSDDWENLYTLTGPDNIVPLSFASEKFRPYEGKSLVEIAKIQNSTPEEVILDLVSEDGDRVFTAFHFASMNNIRKQVGLPWISFGSDAEAPSTEGGFLKYMTHPRAYGTFARVLGQFVRDEHLISLEDAVHRLAALPMQIRKIKDRGILTPGNYADVVVFDLSKVQSHATYAKPHQYATGMIDVFVNGVQVLKDGEHTGLFPGRAIRGPGYIPK